MPGRSALPFIFVSQPKEKQPITRRTFIGGTIGIIVSGGIVGATFYYMNQGVDANDQTNTLQGLPYSYSGHKQTVLSAVWSADGKLIASAGADGTVQIWRTTTGKVLLTYRGHQG
jgi:WD40 repeat protein